MEQGPIAQPSDTQSKRKVQRQKTFTGCWDCRSRKVKCDEATPECTPCRRRGFPCGGYKPVLVWVTPNCSNYEAGRRRVLKSYMTWKGHRIYDSSTIDSLISQCDVSSAANGPCGKVSGPFTVFPSTSEGVPSPRAPPSDTENMFEGHDKRLREDAGFLFHHYASYIALNMMPFEDQRNPWQTFYPLMARCGRSRGHSALLHAMLAQAAGNLAHKSCRERVMSRLTINYYALAIEDLRTDFKKSLGNFSLMLACVLTLIMAEVYGGNFKAWRVHLNGAWAFLCSRQHDEPWRHSEESWLTAQSLCLLKVRCDTMYPDSKIESDSATRLIPSVASRPDFGFTAGANPALISCIIETTQLAAKVSQDGIDAHLEASQHLHQRLEGCYSPQTYSNETLVRLHHRIFQIGAIIYFQRSVFHSLPLALNPYLDELLRLVKLYRELGSGYVTLWPVFIAAVEAYQETHQAGFRQWLDDCDKMGAASRKDIRDVVEGVWQKRASIAAEMSDPIDMGETRVDWREVMSERGLDILLV